MSKAKTRTTEEQLAAWEETREKIAQLLIENLRASRGGYNSTLAARHAALVDAISMFPLPAAHPPETDA